MQVVQSGDDSGGPQIAPGLVREGDDGNVFGLPRFEIFLHHPVAADLRLGGRSGPPLSRRLEYAAGMEPKSAWKFDVDEPAKRALSRGIHSKILTIDALILRSQ